MVVSPAQVAAGVADIRRQRGDGPFEVVLIGASSGPHDPVLGEYADAGVTWWLEHLHAGRAPFPELLSRVNAGAG